MRRRRRITQNSFNFLGFELDIKNSLIALAVAGGVFLILLFIDVAITRVSWYGVLIGTGFILALFFAIKLCEIKGLDPELPYDLLWWVFPFSIIGARLYYVAFNNVTPFFWRAFAIWDGGLAIYGGIIGGFIGLVICCKIKKVDLLKVCDIVAPGLVLGQALGRLGCIFAGCCYGVEVQNAALRWFPIAINVHGDYHFATNFYESILNFILFFVLIWLVRKINMKGLVVAVYLVAYGVYRYFLEFFRDDSQLLLTSFGMPVSQLVSVISVIIGTALLSYILITNKRKEMRY